MSKQFKNSILKKNFYNVEISRMVLKGLLADSLNFCMDDKFYFFFKFSRKLLKKSISYFKNSCFISGYSRSVFCRFRLSRHHAKKLSSSGFVVGMRKSSF
jgi:ribosomal protein S14